MSHMDIFEGDKFVSLRSTTFRQHFSEQDFITACSYDSLTDRNKSDYIQNFNIEL
jgi:hypothetical protein